MFGLFLFDHDKSFIIRKVPSFGSLDFDIYGFCLFRTRPFYFVKFTTENVLWRERKLQEEFLPDTWSEPACTGSFRASERFIIQGELVFGHACMVQAKLGRNA